MRTLIALAAVTLAACAGPLPDGSRIIRDESAVARAVPPLGADEARRLEQQNAQILAEQDAARAREAHTEAMRESQRYAPYYGPYWHGGWLWTGSRWSRRPRWSFGVGTWGP